MEVRHIARLVGGGPGETARIWRVNEDVDVVTA